jgi:GT2 family glycosyltransferase
MTTTRTLLVTVNYGPPQDTLDLLSSLAQFERLDELEVIVVDSASTPATRVALENGTVAYPGRLQLRYEDENVYYWGGAERALRAVRAERGALPAWVIICNADILIEQRDFLERLQRCDRAGVGVVAPAVISAAHGGDQNPLLAQRPSLLYHLRWRLYYAHYGVAWLLRALWQAARRSTRVRAVQPVPSEGAAIYAPHGAFVCLRREFFERGGWLDTNFRLYAEEHTLAETVLRLGLQVVYQPAIEVVHRESGATGKALTRWEYEVTREAYDYFRRAYLGASPRERAAAARMESA